MTSPHYRIFPSCWLWKRAAAAGFVCDISPPALLKPKGGEITLPAGNQIEVTFTSSFGTFDIRIGLAEPDVQSAGAEA